MKWQFTYVSAWLLLLAVLLVACKKPAPPGREAAKPAKPRAVKIARAELRPMERAVTVTGALAALDRSTLAIKVAGRLKEISVDLGSAVQQGQVIAMVEPRDYELQVKLAEAAVSQSRAALGLPLEGTNEVTNLEEVSLVRQNRALFEEAARSYARVAALVQAKVASASEYDRVVAELNVSSNRLVAAVEEARRRQAELAQRRAELEIAQQQLKDTQLRAPYPGVIESRLVSGGEYLAAGTPVVTLVRTDILRLRLEVPEREAAEVRLGQPIRFQVEGDTNAFIVRSTRLSPSISEQSRMLIAESDVEGKGALRPGSFVRADIILNEHDHGLMVPTDALVVFAGLEKVVTIRDKKALEKTVTTGRRGLGWVEIVAGLNPGVAVVLSPGNLRTGEPVVIAPADMAATPSTNQATTASP